MIYSINTTEAIVLSYTNKGEHDRLYKLFTKDIGMVLARASGIRKKESKLAGHLVECGIFDVSLVSGREFWRMTGAEENIFYKNIWQNKVARLVYFKILSLLKRLIHGEEKNSDLFVFLIKSLSFFNDMLSKSSNSLDMNLSSFENLVVLNVLHKLGYIKPDVILSRYLTKEITSELLDQAKNDSKKIISEINKSLEETHL